MEKEENGIDNLFKKSMDIRRSQNFCHFMDYLSRFSHYSFYNSMLIYIQNPKVEYFGSARYWERMFQRTVREDAKPYIALMPFGPIMLMYDIMDTEGKEDVNEIIDTMKEFDSKQAGGKIEKGFLSYVISRIKEFNINVDNTFLLHSNDALIQSKYPYDSFEIKLNERLSDEAAFGALMHELAHLLLGHLGIGLIYRKNRRGKIVEQYRVKGRDPLSHGQKELEAETVSFLICRRYGLEPRSAEYLSCYLEDEEMLSGISYDLLLKTADKIISMFFPKDYIDSLYESSTRKKG